MSMSSRFDLNKMVETIDNLSICLDIMLCCKDNEGGQQILESYLQLDNLNNSLNDQIDVLKKALTKEKDVRQTAFLKHLEELKTIEDRCNYMIENAPLNFCHGKELETQQSNQHFGYEECKGNNFNEHSTICNMSMSPVPRWNDTYCSTGNNTVYHTTVSNGTMMSTTVSSKLQVTKQTPVIPLLKSVDNTEMDAVPKYMKGRLTSLNVNVVIDGINVALENKYDILQKSRNALKKKDLDMYNTWKIQQKVVGQGQYFITANDITRFSETKVDKTTLNIIPILRHLKRLKESRVGGSIYYLPY